MFSQTVEYALRAVVHLASEAPRARTTEEIAKVTHVPQAYLAKVLQNLVQAGVLRSQRGLGGGIALIKKPGELTILEVVSAVDPIPRIRECPLGLAGHGVSLCALHKRLDSALASVEHAFGQTTLQEILDETSDDAPLCGFPPRQDTSEARPLGSAASRGPLAP